MSETQEHKLKEDIVQRKNEQFEEAREAYLDGRISEQEFEARVEGLVDSGDDFINHDDTNTAVEETVNRVEYASSELVENLKYYSLPISVTFVVGLLFLFLPASMAFSIFPVIVLTLTFLSIANRKI